MSRTLRSFREMIGLTSRGDFSRHLDEQMGNCLEALEAMPAEKGKAEMTIKIVFNYELGRVDIDPSCKVKLPEGARFMRTPFWVIDGELSVEHPNQVDMFNARPVRGEDSEAVNG